MGPWESQDVKWINKMIWQQAMHGTRTVQLQDGSRVVRARTIKGQLQARLMSGKWVSVESITVK